MEIAVVAAVAALVMLFVLAEIAAAVLPIIIIVVLVPPAERDALARLIAACDSSRKLRLWPALRVAVEARRRTRKDDPRLNSHRNPDAPFDRAQQREAVINQPRDHAVDVDSPHSPAGLSASSDRQDSGSSEER